MTDLQYDGVLLAGFGGPESPDDVMPFLRNVTRGRGVPEERLVEVSHHYLALGGSSPINVQNRALAAALESELVVRGFAIPVLLGNRNWTPYLAEIVAEAHRNGQHRLLGLATSAYSSYSSCRQYREDFAAALNNAGVTDVVQIDKVRPFFDQLGFLSPTVDSSFEALSQAAAQGFSPDEIEIVFTTHSIPSTMADSSGSDSLGDHGAGGAYVAQHLAACRFVVGALTGLSGHEPNWQLAYQSRSGPPAMPWLEPDVNDVIRNLSAAGRNAVVVVPIGFISDHVEVIWDLDNEAAESAAAEGLWFARVSTPGVDPRFVGALADLVVARLTDKPISGRVRDFGARERPDFCAPGCCRNLRGVKPTVAGQDSAADCTESALVGAGRPERG